MQTKKLPAAGEWWVSNDGSEIAYICGFDPDGDPVYQIDECSNADIDLMSAFLAEYHQEPLCDSFTWKPAAPIDPGEDWELLPVGTVLEDGDEASGDNEYLGPTSFPGRRIGDEGTAPYYRRRKAVVETTKPAESPDDWVELGPEYDGHILRHSIDELKLATASEWHKVTTRPVLGISGKQLGTEREGGRYEFRCRRKDLPPLPESPDDWVEITDPEHVLREGIDEVWYSFKTIVNEWQQVFPSAGMKLEDSQYKKARCRRRDLPPLPAPQPKRIPVRLWVHKDSRNDDRYNVFAKISEPDERYLYVEIKIGPDGLYLEGGE